MAAAAERVFEILAEKEEAPDAPDAVSPAVVGADIEFKHVRFGFDEKATVISDWNYSIKGPDGGDSRSHRAGKDYDSTSLLYAVLRCLDGGGDKGGRKKYKVLRQRRTPPEFRNWCFKDTWLFKGTIM
jgi:ATP-binding cassette subfamily B protein